MFTIKGSLGKRTFLFFAIVSTLFISVCVSASELTSEKPEYKVFLEAFLGTHKEIIAELEREKENINELTKLMHEANKLSNLMEKNIKNDKKYSFYNEKFERLMKHVMEKYGVAFYAASYHLNKLITVKLQQKQIEESFEDATELYKDTLSCFNQGKYSGKKTCESFRKVCSGYGSEEGNMYYYELTNDLEVTKVDVSKSDPRLLEQTDDQLKNIWKDAYHFCRLLSLTTKSFSTNTLAKVPPVYNLIEGFYGYVLPYPEFFKKLCVDKKPSEVRISRLLNLKSQYPNAWIVTKYSTDYDKWKVACSKSAQQLCPHAYIIKDRVILTYETVACALRDVTKEDVERDIAWMELHSDKLKQSSLSDTIEVCQLAYNNGFFWQYLKPTLSDKCKKETSKAKRKGGKRGSK